MNRKIKRYHSEIQKTEDRIAELQSYLKAIKSALKQEEDLEIIKSFREMKLGGQELMDVLDGIRKGTLTFQTMNEPYSDEEYGSYQYNEQKQSKDEIESEENNDDESKENE